MIHTQSAIQVHPFKKIMSVTNQNQNAWSNPYRSCCVTVTIVPIISNIVAIVISEKCSHNILDICKQINMFLPVICTKIFWLFTLLLTYQQLEVTICT